MTKDTEDRGFTRPSLASSKEYLLEVIQRQDRELAILAALVAEKNAPANTPEEDVAKEPESQGPVAASLEEPAVADHPQEPVRSRRFWRR